MKPQAFAPGDRVEIVRKGTVRHSGVVIDRRWGDDAGAYTTEVETLRVQVDELGPRSFSREVSERGVVSKWRPKAKDMKRIGRFEIRREETKTFVVAPGARQRVIEEGARQFGDDDAIEEDAVREMGGDDFVEYERATGKQIGNK
jgi:hypothetical protein